MNLGANADGINVEMAMEETVALGATQRAVANPPTTAPVAAEPSPVFKPLATDGLGGAQRNDIDMILDIPIQLTAELGRTKVSIKDLLQLTQGSVVELNALAGKPMGTLVSGYPIAQGEIVVANEKFGIRLTDVITPSERIRKLNRQSTPVSVPSSGTLTATSVPPG